MSQQGIASDVTTPAADVEKLTGDTGTAVPDAAGAIAVIGTAAQGISTSGAVNTLTLTIANATDAQKGVASFPTTDFSVSSGAVTDITKLSLYVVGATGAAYTLVQDAVTAASAVGGGTIYIRSGTYTEDVSFPNGDYELIGCAATGENSAVIINGVIDPPDSGSLSCSTITFDSASNIFDSPAAGTAQIFLSNCYLYAPAGAIFNLDSWQGILNISNCTSPLENDTTIIQNIGQAPLTILDSRLGSTTADESAANGVVTISNSYIGCPFRVYSTGEFNPTNSKFANGVTLEDTAEATCTFCTFAGDGDTAFTQNSSGTVNFIRCDFHLDAAAITPIAGVFDYNLVDCTFSTTAALGAINIARKGRVDVRTVYCEGFNLEEGSDKRAGGANLAAGTVTVMTAAIEPTSHVILAHQGGGVGAVGALSLGAIVANTSFVINSTSGADDGVVYWIIVNPA